MKTMKELLEAKKAANLKRKELLAAGTEANKYAIDKDALAAVDAEIDNIDTLIAAMQKDMATAAAAPVASLGADGKADETPASPAILRGLVESQGQDLSALLGMARAAKAKNVMQIVATNKDAPFKTFAEYAHAVVVAGKKKGNAPADLMNKLNGVAGYNQKYLGTVHGANQTADDEGGFVTPFEFQAPMMDAIINQSQLAPLCTRLPVSGPGVNIPRILENSRANGSRFGGVSANWLGEGASVTTSKPKWQSVRVPVNKLGILVPITDEMMQDAPFMSAYISTLGAAEMGFKVDDAIVRGTGQGQPMGILNASSLVTQAAESGQTAGTIVRKNIHNMYSRVIPGRKSNMVWIGNQEVMPQLLELKDEAGRLIFSPAGRIDGNPLPATLLGRPYYEVEQASAVGTVGDLMAVDLTDYLLLDRGGVQTDVSIHFYFDTDEQAMRMLLRIGGVPLTSQALTPYKGTAARTLSPYVALATR